MKIRDIDVFDLYGDGTMVIKTDMNGAEKKRQDYRYAWYVLSGDGKTVLSRILYQERPCTVWQLPRYGTYQVRAFVKCEGSEDKVRRTVSFRADRRTSPDLGRKRGPLLSGPPTVERISGPFYKMCAAPDPALMNAQYAWYIYRTDEPDPVIKRLYQDAPEYVCAIHEPGEYFVKVFVLADGKKDSMKSEIFMVE